MTPLLRHSFRWVCLLCLLVPIRAAQEQFNEAQVKAGFLLKIVEFVKWPDNGGEVSTGAITIGILGEDPFAGELERLIQGQTVLGRKLAVKRAPSIGALRGCQILFVSRSEKSRLGEVLSGIKADGILTISDMQQFSKRGGMIQLFVVSENLRYNINMDAIQRAGLNLSSQIMKKSVPPND